MSLYKTTPIGNIQMHPLEEAATLANWAIHEERIKIPPKPTQQDEHEWLLEHGAQYVKQKRAEWQQHHDLLQPNVEKAEKIFQEKHDIWNEHIEFCVKNGLDPDTYRK